MAEPRATGAGKAADTGVWDRKDTEAPPNLPAQPEVSSLPGVRLVLTSPLGLLSLECRVSGITGYPPCPSPPAEDSQPSV